MNQQVFAWEAGAKTPHRPTPAAAADVLLGDAFDRFERLSRGSIDLVLTSPPYWGHRDYGLEHNLAYFNDLPSVRRIGPQTPGYAWYRGHGGVLGLEPYPEWFVSHLSEILHRAARPLATQGSMWINLGDTLFARWASIREKGRQGLGSEQRERRKTPLGGVRQEKNLLLIPVRFAIAMQELGWILRNDVIRHKPNAVPRPEGDRLRSTHEHSFDFVKKPKAGRPKYYYGIGAVEPRAADVVTVDVAPGEAGHTATFPRDLIEPRIRSSCPPGGTVLDPFSGTGRTLEVARMLGRRAVGFDVQPRFVELRKASRDQLGHRQAWLPVDLRTRRSSGAIARFRAREPQSARWLRNAGRSRGCRPAIFQDKLGGEISLAGTARSPELSFDVTLVEVRPTAAGGFEVSRHGILEILTMDYHGTYRRAVSNLRDDLNAFICVFDLDSLATTPTSPVRIEHFIRVSPERLVRHAFTEVPDHIRDSIESGDAVLARIRRRLAEWWPGIDVPQSKGRRPQRRT